MTLNEYQEAVAPSKAFPDLVIRPQPYNGSEMFYEDDEEVRHLQSAIDNSTSLAWIYPALGLAGETGEVIEKLKKAVRDKEGHISEADKVAIKKELGDVLWYLTTLATELGISLEDIATTNIEKFMDRRARGVTAGSGDNR
jgi:NTP pyrophosphatase (non-canonical NTP hydrolase)